MPLGHSVPCVKILKRTIANKNICDQGTLQIHLPRQTPPPLANVQLNNAQLRFHRLTLNIWVAVRCHSMLCRFNISFHISSISLQINQLESFFFANFMKRLESERNLLHCFFGAFCYSSIGRKSIYQVSANIRTIFKNFGTISLRDLQSH